MDDMQELTLATAELGLEAAVMGREALSLLQLTILAPAEDSLVLAGLEEGKVFSAEAKEKRGQNIASSHCRICIQSLKALTESENFGKP